MTDVKTVAVTGATGFLGRYLLDSLLQAGYAVKALTRRPQKPREGLSWIEGDLADTSALTALVTAATCVIHAAALTMARDRDTFFAVNRDGTNLLLARAAAAGIDHFIHVSSIAAREPRLSDYGASKAAADLLISAHRWPFSWVCLRPPAVYGPGDHEIIKLLKLAKLGLLVAPGSQQNRFGMIHARDLAKALTLMVRYPNSGQILELDDGKAGGYRMRDIADLMPNTSIGARPSVITVPRAGMITLGYIALAYARLTRGPLALNPGTARYLCHPDMTARHARRPDLGGWHPETPLAEGFSETINWYRDQGLL